MSATLSRRSVNVSFTPTTQIAAQPSRTTASRYRSRNASTMDGSASHGVRMALSARTTLLCADVRLSSMAAHRLRAASSASPDGASAFESRLRPFQKP